MLYFRTLFLGYILLIAFGCSSGSDVTGSYLTEVSQGSGKQIIVGELDLRPDGQYRAEIGELRMSGEWTSGNGRLFLRGADDVSSFLPQQYRVDGPRLIAQFEGVDAKQWRFVKKRSQAVANRLH